MTTIPVEAQALIDRLAAVDVQDPVIDPERVEQAFCEHFLRLGIDPLPVRWETDAALAYDAAWWAAWVTVESAAWSAAESAARSAAESAARWAAPWATRSATRSAAESAAWSAAESRAQSAAESAAESAPRPLTRLAWGAWWAMQSATRPAARSAARSAAESAAWTAARTRGAKTDLDALDRYIGIWLPFVDAYEAGLWLYWIYEREVIAVPRPSLRIRDGELHCEDGPAVWWPEGARYFFWRGVQVPAEVIEQPDSLTAGLIIIERNVEVRRAMLERVGYERLLDVAVGVHRDEFGVLYRINQNDDEPILLVRVVNATPERDGSLRRYFLRVPPTVRTAREAVAWTFERTPKTYGPDVES